jgi:uncharacterized OsmC-like protein
VQDGDDVRAGEDRAELEGELVGVGAGWELALVLRLPRGLLEELAPLPLVRRDAVVDAAGAPPQLGRGGDEEAAAGEHPALDVGQEPLAEREPGELLCAALAACADISVRMVADLLRVQLDELEVDVSGELDVRGTLDVDRSVPVGFQRLAMAVRVQAAPETPPARIDHLAAAAERACVVLDTLRRGVPVDVTFDAGPA